MLNEISNSFSNFTGAIIDVCEWISNSNPTLFDMWLLCEFIILSIVSTCHWKKMLTFEQSSTHISKCLWNEPYLPQLLRPFHGPYGRSSFGMWNILPLTIYIKTPMPSMYPAARVASGAGMPIKGWNEIGCTVEVWEWTDKFIPSFIMYVITCTCCD